MDIEFALLITFLSSISGAGAYLHSTNDKEWNFFSLTSELILSISVGLCVAYFCEYKDLSRELACCLAIATANNADDIVTKGKAIASHLIQKRLGINLDKKGD